MSRQQGQGDATTEGAAFPWILEHLLTYPGTYEIPLRTMYTLNANTQAQQNPDNVSPNHLHGNAFPPRPQNPEETQTMSTQTAAAQLRANLVSHISQQPSQPASLPPTFITSFVRRVFPVQLDLVDFPQALTALDYLKDLEVRRRREVVAALNRLGVDKNDFLETERLGKKYPGVLRWLIEIEEKERKIEALYTQVYLGLRRWTLINEMSLQPFNKANCLAMLNTLYPPVNAVQPTAQLRNEVLVTQRNGFFRYIQNVEKNGPSLLTALINQGKSPGHENGWFNVRDTVDRYLRSANAIIEECYQILGREVAISPTASSFEEREAEEQRARKVDSGISFTLNKTQGQRTSTSTTSSTKSKDRTGFGTLSSQQSERNDKPAGSTLERIAREIRKIRSRGDVGDPARQDRKREKSRTRAQTPDASSVGDSTPPVPPLPELKEKKLRLKPSLKKMRSISALGERNRNLSSAGNSRVGSTETEDMPDFDVEDMRRRRMEWETKRARQDQHKFVPSSDAMDESF